MSSPTPSPLYKTSPSSHWRSQSISFDKHSWKGQIFQEIQSRNRAQRDNWKPVFQAYEKLLDRENELRQQKSQLEKDLALSSALGGSSSPGDVVDSSQIRVLNEKVSDMQKQLIDSLSNAQKKSDELERVREQAQKTEQDLINQISEKERILKQKEAEVSKLQDDVDYHEQRTTRLESTIETLRTEIASMKKQLDTCDTTIRTLQKENKQLVNKTMQIQNERAEEMNQMNEMYDSLVKKAEAQRLKVESEEKVQSIKSDVDLADSNSIFDAIAWQSNFDVKVPSAAKKNFPAHNGQATCVRFNAQGTLLMSAGTDKRVHIWDARAATIRATLHGANQSVMCTAFSPDEQLVLATGNDKTGRVYDMKTSRVRHTLTGHQKKICACCFSSDSQRAITGSYDRTIKIWDMKNGYCVRNIMCTSSVNYLSLSPNGDLIASAHLDKNIRFWSMRTGETMHELSGVHKQQATCAEFSRDGTMVVTNSRDSTLALVDVRNFGVIRTLKHPQDLYKNPVNWGRASFSPDAQFVVAGSEDGSLFVWDVGTGKVHSKLSNNLPRRDRRASYDAVATPAVTCVAWNRNGRQIASCDNLGHITLWEA